HSEAAENRSRNGPCFSFVSKLQPPRQTKCPPRPLHQSHISVFLAFSTAAAGGTQAYIEYMRPRCVELARVLKKTGSFYYHCDWHASHYVKVMLDQILGGCSF